MVGCFRTEAFRLHRLPNDRTTQCSYVLVEMNKGNYNQKKIKDGTGVFLDRNSNVSAISCTYSTMLSYFTCTSNLCYLYRVHNISILL